MNLNEKLIFLQELLLDNSGLYTSVYDFDLQLIDTNSPAQNTLTNLLFLGVSDVLKDMIKESGQVYIYTNALSLSWALLPYSNENTSMILAAGPVFYQEFSERVFKHRMDMEQMPVSSQINMLQLLHLIPIISYSNFVGFAGMYFHTLYRRKMTTADYSQLNETDPDDQIMQQPHAGSAISITTHGTYAYETEMQRCVEEGDLNYNERLEALQTYRSNLIVGTMSPTDPLRQMKDSIIVQTALATRAAIRGGMDPDAAYSLSDFYVQRIEYCSEETEVLALSAQMFRSFVTHVHALRDAPASSPVIRQCCAWIQKEICSDIKLSDFADRLGYTPYYLSNVFKEETGQSFSEYVREKKIEHAKFLLTSTALSITEISDHLAFSAPSYFISCFKKFTGMTPRQYRTSAT